MSSGTDQPLINIDPGIMGGEPVFMRTRVPIRTIVDYLAGGASLEEFLDNFPSVTREQAIRFIEQRHGAPAA